MRLSPFGDAIRHVEAERMAEAQATLDEGWTPADHPTNCCPPEAKTAKRVVRPRAEVERLRVKAANKAKWWADTVTRKQAALDARDSLRPRFDHGMLNTPVGPRAREANTGQRMWQELEHAKERAGHFRRLAAKYEKQLSDRDAKATP